MGLQLLISKQYQKVSNNSNNYKRNKFSNNLIEIFPKILCHQSKKVFYIKKDLK